MNEDEIRRVVREAVLETLREVFLSDADERRYYRERFVPFRDIEELGYQVNRFGTMLSLFEKKFTGSVPCRYEKDVVDAIKSDTSKI